MSKQQGLATGDDARVRFRDWLIRSTVLAGRGDEIEVSDVAPSNRFWLGRLQTEDAVLSDADARGERLDPCAIGLHFRLRTSHSIRFIAIVTCSAWLRDEDRTWKKVRVSDITIPIDIDDRTRPASQFGKDLIASALATATGKDNFCARIDVEETVVGEASEFRVALVNCGTAIDERGTDARLYECSLSVRDASFVPFSLESLPESYRYEREVLGYGINCGVDFVAGTLRTNDVVLVDTWRPKFWGGDSAPPNLKFGHLVRAAADVGDSMVSSLAEWGDSNWQESVLDDRASSEGWTREMRLQASEDAKRFWDEMNRIRQGVSLLRANVRLARAFACMHKAMEIVGQKRGYDAWRPFQYGFLLANLASVVPEADETEADIVDVVWFATGGGKTETYLGLLIAAAFYDRLSGKLSGITAWSRFPLRMLSLQQTQRFADALAAAELVRRAENVEGAPMSLGFFIGSGATPNKVLQEKEDADKAWAYDPQMPSRYRVLEYCPFCRNANLTMDFNHETWTLDHICGDQGCPWPEKALPIHIVDEEIYRFLPTILVGTLDKAALIAFQQAMRGVVGAPWGICARAGHGFTYAPRSDKKNGCLVPGCAERVNKLPQPAGQYAPRYRLQDELHLLRDSLGAVDSHYESLYDTLCTSLGAPKPKILASSATLRGYERQVDELYCRKARLFPSPGPKPGVGFWSARSPDPMRQFVGIAPRGLTLEWVNDCIMHELQKCVRELVEHPASVCNTLGIALESVEHLVAEYGTQVVYGNSLRDIEAVQRSGEIQMPINGHPINWENLTGKTNFSDITRTLKRLQSPEPDYYERIHAITASSMMSHGVDVDRLNAMVMLGLPLGAAEFIQATARVGRRFPGLVFVIHKIGRERDAAVFRMFREFVTQADRFVEPVPISRRSRRVLDRTVAGLALARILMLHEITAGKPLTTIGALQKWATDCQFDWSGECEATIRMLNFNGALDEGLRADLQGWYAEFADRIRQPPAGARWPSDASISGEPMKSLRDVDTQIPVHGSRIQ